MVPFLLKSIVSGLLIPALLRHGIGFWSALAASCALTVALYAAATWLGPRFGLPRRACVAASTCRHITVWPLVAAGVIAAERRVEASTSTNG